MSAGAPPVSGPRPDEPRRPGVLVPHSRAREALRSLASAIVVVLFMIGMPWVAAIVLAAAPSAAMVTMIAAHHPQAVFR